MVGIVITLDEFVSHPKPLLLLRQEAFHHSVTLLRVCVQRQGGADLVYTSHSALTLGSLVTIHALPVFPDPLQRGFCGILRHLCSWQSLVSTCQSLERALTPTHDIGKEEMKINEDWNDFDCRLD